MLLELKDVKKQGKKDVAYDMLCYILDWEAKDENKA